jgi:hypothetical protein
MTAETGASSTDTALLLAVPPAAQRYYWSPRIRLLWVRCRARGSARAAYVWCRLHIGGYGCDSQAN